MNAVTGAMAEDGGDGRVLWLRKGLDYASETAWMGYICKSAEMGYPMLLCPWYVVDRVLLGVTVGSHRARE